MAAAKSDSIHVLHVDDEPEFAELAAEFVERQDERVDVETATNPAEGLDRIRANGVHCVVSDYDMPGRNGIEFLEAVRKEFPHLPFILFTGKGSEEVAGVAISSGVTDYLQKQSGTSQYQVLANRIENAVEQHRAKDAAEETEQRLRSITDDVLDATEVGVFILDANFEVGWCNGATEDFFGIDRTEVIGRDKRQVINEEIADVFEDPDRFEEKVLGAYDDNTYTEQFECHVLPGDGRANLWLSHLSHPIESGLFEGGRVEIYTEITNQKEREQQLKREGERFQAVFDEAFDGMVIADDQGQFIAVNESAVELFGVPENKLLGRSIQEFAPDDFDFETAWQKFQASDNERGTFPLTQPDGTQRTVEYAATRDIVPGQHLSIMRDITE